MVKLSIRYSHAVAFANYIGIGQEFTAGNLESRLGFAGLGEYKPFDAVELDEMRNAVYVIYSYRTPIAWKTKSGVWVRNTNTYSVSTRQHQNKIFAALDSL